MLTAVIGTQRTSALSPQACPESGGSSDALEGPWDPAAVTGPDPNLPKLPQGTQPPALISLPAANQRPWISMGPLAESSTELARDKSGTLHQTSAATLALRR